MKLGVQALLRASETKGFQGASPPPSATRGRGAPPRALSRHRAQGVKVLLTQSRGVLGILGAHRCRAIGFRARANPCEQHQPTEHYKSWDFRLIFGRQIEQLAITPDPSVQQFWGLGFVL